MKVTVLGDEAVALGALDAGLSAAYGYPGTPSTEIMERLLAEREGGAAVVASWCANEKTALEAALGASYAGRRALVTMKHVGLNVAADPFVCGALLRIKGGLVLAVADDPGMHSSQNEQDTRRYAAFAGVLCLEPRNQQEAYDMTRLAFDLSERFNVPVLLRLVTRLSHARAGIETAPARAQNRREKALERTAWMLLPVYGRLHVAALAARQTEFTAWSEGCTANRLEMEGADEGFAVITSGLGGNYYEENLEDLRAARGGRAPARLHIGAYPIPAALVRRVCEGAERVLVLEEGQPFVEERLRGLLPARLTVNGKLDGTVVRTGELDPDNVRAALGLPGRPSVDVALPPLPGRPPQLCQGCPHADSFETLKAALSGIDERELAVTSDIGCYSLGAFPPFGMGETILCMGASIGMARGAAEAGLPYAVAVIGDSTFLHSGLTALVDAAAAGTALTIVILDNSAVAMTGCQTPMLPSARLREIVLGIGVTSEHVVALEAKTERREENAKRLRVEIEYRGLSVVLFQRECLESLRLKRKKAH